MKQVTLAEFIKGYEEGYITDVVTVKDRVFGKDPRGRGNLKPAYDIVYAMLP